ncbi:beta-ketoacyl synthase domain-containing protein [Zopfia rhizophila CBS 207.26]|uniref:Beta-ketoacyl synthase domain-containing protein n=1 Tax=Zopfia rhizophila CBS 207.26 TaxID=1314779 RepID=A0A6A6DXR5_9PEZI|nr:beta-ketoacyl synthase domain-containing protein [Zopfia rhizophila CBS 207.26]
MADVSEPIAIIGSGCRLPGGSNAPSKLWDLLKQPRDLLRQIPTERFNAEGFYHPDGLYHGHSNVLHSYTLSEDPRQFDAQFFGIKPIEAMAIDPQQRLLLEVVYESLEAAGFAIEDLRGSDTGVYVGVMCADYEAMLLRDFQEIPTYHSVGTARSILSNRISYFFDWHGPSITIDTACSSSLVALHQAVQALRIGDSKVALACGSNLLLGPENYVAESKLKMLSPDSRSMMWDEDANGYARGDGVAAVVLKTLSAAIADGDQIECLIRETGVNHDGRTNGITMPSATAQAALIRQTYAKAGLDPRKEQDRCQYFEAHGTGTPAGDPIEAEAISAAFFGDSPEPQTSPLYVGSVKTVIGHTEGTAGIAAVLKASLAMRNGYIPPNMLLTHLSRRVLPFCHNIEVPTVAKPWPALLKDNIRRASVNSFGFGGTNAHAILESYQPRDTEKSADMTPMFAPFVFSAGSEQSLQDNLLAYANLLKTHPYFNPRDLAWTLSVRRSALPLKVTFPATSIESLRSNIEAKLEDHGVDGRREDIGRRLLTASTSGKPRVLGVFTGQGAQYARMGAELIEQSPFARQIIKNLEARLNRLSDADRPSWSLLAELLAPSSSSRISESALSQPLCTAVQIVLVDMLRLANIKLDAVVGHSSGEIAAAYASGYLSADDAICIAYYRGLHSKLAVSPRGVTGAMLAVGTSWTDAAELCEEEEFLGRLAVAASNSPSSVTISGDEDAIADAEVILEDEKKFRRRLKVDVAYHSHHMLACSDAYVHSLRALNIQVQDPPSGCSWLSSVYAEDAMGAKDKLRDVYWDTNMVQPVLFSQAIEKACSLGRFDIAIEIGPHPALKGPTSQTIQELTNQIIPYSGLLFRGGNAIEAASNAIGFLWTLLGKSGVDLEAYETGMSGHTSCTLLKDLPTYQWDHTRIYWHESRLSRVWRTRKYKVHQLLGDLAPDRSPNCLSWRNLLRPKEVPWIRGHQLQNQIVFPAAGYVASAMEASKWLMDDDQVQLIEIVDFIIHAPMVFNEDDAGVEVLVTLNEINRNTLNLVKARFTYSAAVGNGDTLTTMASCELSHTLGAPSTSLLPERPPKEPNLVAVEDERFYSALETIGYVYSKPFRGLSTLKRKLNKASGLLAVTPYEETEDPFIIHPAMLDAALQSIILALSYPSDGQLWSLHVPTQIRRIRLNPDLCRENHRGARDLPFDSSVTEVLGTGITGDVEVYGKDTEHAVIQLEGMTAVPFSPATAANDSKLFSHKVWNGTDTDGYQISCDIRASNYEYELAYACERIALFYLRLIDQQTPLDHPVRVKEFKSYFNYASHVLGLLSSGKHKYAKQEWLDDTQADIDAVCERYIRSSDIKTMRAVGEQMPKVIRGESTILEHLIPTGLLDDYYVSALGFPQYSSWLGRMAAQLVHRYQRMNILEIGVLKNIGQGFSSYTFTDISSGFFEKAQEVFAPYKSKMIFKGLDIEGDVSSQGYTDHSYDLVIASFVIHATKKLEHTLRNVRRLLKPGGFLLVAEGTNNSPTRAGFIFGTLPGWWLGAEDGRVLSPFVSSSVWDSKLRQSGFSGIDTITHELDHFPWLGSVFVSQAIDDRVAFLRQPLSPPPSLPLAGMTLNDLWIIGGRTLRVARLAHELHSIFTPLSSKITSAESIEDVDYGIITPASTILCLVELDEPVFQDLSEAAFLGLKQIFGSEKTMFWVTEGRRADSPYSNMTIGFGRSQLWEVPDLRIQFFDLENVATLDARLIAEALLRFHTGSRWVCEDSKDKILWSVEPEIVVDAKGKQIIPRQEESRAANDRLNSFKRRLTKDATNATLVWGLDRYLVQDAGETDAQDEFSAKLSIRNCLLPALKTVSGFHFLAFAIDVAGGGHYALVESPRSRFHGPQDITVPCDVPSGLEAHYSLFVAANIIAANILRAFIEGQTILVHELTAELATVLSRRAAEKGIIIVYTTMKERDVPPSWISISLLVSQRVLKSILPAGVSAIVDLSNDSLPRSLGSHIRKACHPRCQYVQRDSLIAPSAHVFEPDFLTILDWTPSEPLRADVHPVDSNPLVKADRTYWLVGLSGDLGLSLCDWMIDHGAKHVVISSRDPKVAHSWLDIAARKGAVIKIYASDVTKEQDLQRVHKDIYTSLPPIAGVAQGAMVLVDTATRDMTYDQIMAVLRPKVHGSVYLDRIFTDQQLDFFVFFSSMTGVIGNIGQANYTAANLFMCSLAAQRRKRGLAASVINIGVIISVGYVTREMSERDFHQSFTEAILVGKKDPRCELELLTGLRHVPANSPYLPIWHNNPVFAKFIVQETRTETENATKSAIPIKTRLLEATTRGDVLNVITETFLAKLQVLLQLDSTESIVNRRTDELGLDSLIAVDIRSWFFKVYQVNMPVLKILGGVSIADLVAHAMENIPQELVPNIDLSRNAPTAIQEVKSLGGLPILTIERPSEETTATSESSKPGDVDTSSFMSSAQSTSSASDYGPVDLTKEVSQLVIERSQPLSYCQSMFWFVHILMEDKTTLNHTGLFRLRGNLRINDFRRAVRMVGERHESLRTSFVVQEDQQLEHQQIHDTSEVNEEYERMKNHVYGLSTGQTLRLKLLTVSSTEHYMILGCHHINLDAYKDESMDTPALQYLDYASMQRAQHDMNVWEKELRFWRNEFPDTPDPLPLKFSRHLCRRTQTEYAVHKINVRIETQLANRIRDVARKVRSTSFHFYLAAFKNLLHHCTGAQNFCIGIADAEAKTKAYAALANARVPFEVILNELHAFVDYRQGTREKQSFAECQLEMQEFEPGRSAYDLSLDIIDNPGGDALIMMLVQKDLYTQSDGKIFAEIYEDILRAYSADPSRHCSTEFEFRRSEVEKARAFGQGKFFASSWPGTLMHRFKSFARTKPEYPAVKLANGETWTYSRLAGKVDATVSELLSEGVQPGSTVAVFQEPSPEWTSSMLAILHVGAIYVPLDPGMPSQRLAMIVADCRPVAILVHNATVERYPALEARHATLINTSTTLATKKKAINCRARIDGLAIVLYTSGSTGVPKGIAIKHSSLKNEVEVSANVYNLNGEVVLQQSYFSFDMSVLQIFLAFGLGGTLCMIPGRLRGDPMAISKVIAEENVTYTCATPSEYISWLTYGNQWDLQKSSWRAALSGGEKVTEALLRKFRALGKLDLRLYNGYGPTETTCSSTKMELSYFEEGVYKGQQIPAGFVSPNESVYILDEKQRLLPVGLPGEIVIGGIGVAQGYLNNEELTNASFLPDRFLTDDSAQFDGWKRMYRTGDRGRWLNNGSIVIEGRLVDELQVKLHGQRFDLRDVEETTLNTAKGYLVEMAASIRPAINSDHEFLVAHVVFSPTKVPPQGNDEFLKDLIVDLPLPRFMCPSAIIAVDKMPTTVSGKLDRRAVGALAIPQTAADRSLAAHFTETEKRLKEAWEALLPKDLAAHHRIRANSDFFHVGGNSMLLVELQARIRERFGVLLPLIHLFESSTLELMASRIERSVAAPRKRFIDWEEETRPTIDLARLAVPSPTPRIPAHPEVVVLTGATGLVGGHILRRLASDPRVKKIHCVGVRNLQEKEQHLRFNKVMAHPGNLSLPLLGLSEATAAAIFQEVDAIIHNGADLSHLKNYHSLYPVNVGSTKELARLSLVRRIPIHYISTAGTSMFIPRETFEEVSVSSTPPPTNGSSGYTASKWASERYLERMNEIYGLPVCIHRPSSIVRPTEDMRGDNPLLDLLQKLLQYSRKLKAVPTSPNLRGTLDFVSVENVTKGIIAAVLENRSRDSSYLTYLHHTGDLDLPLSDMKEFLEKETGQQIETFPMREWADKAEQAGLHPAAAEAFRAVEHDELLAFPKFVKRRPRVL